MTTRASRSDRGDTLLELIVAIAIMGIALTAIIGALGSSILVSDVHRKQATAGAGVRNYAEAIQTFVNSGGYVNCAGPSSYAAAGYTSPTGYSASQSSATTWNGSAWTSCVTDPGLQRITLQVASNDGRASEQLTLVLRRCSVTSSQCV